MNTRLPSGNVDFVWRVTDLKPSSDNAWPVKHNACHMPFAGSGTCCLALRPIVEWRRRGCLASLSGDKECAGIVFFACRGPHGRRDGRIAFGNGTLSVKRDFHLRPQVGRVVSWRDGGAGGAEISHVGAMPAPGHERMDAVGRNWA